MKTVIMKQAKMRTPNKTMGKVIQWEKVRNGVTQHGENIVLGAITIAGITVGIKNRDTIANLVSSIRNNPKTLAAAGTVVQKVAREASKKPAMLPALSGNRLSPRGLGNVVSCSAQSINKKLIEKGLQVRGGNGYQLTELGKRFGVVTSKITRHDHAFINIEWDEAVLKILFSAEELQEIAARQERWHNLVV